MRILFIICTLLMGQHLLAQNSYNPVQWASQPKLHTVEPKFAEASAVYVLDKRQTEYVIEKDGFFVYRTLHRIVHINNDKGIEAFNKVYLPFNEGLEMVEVKARTILPGGKIIELDKKNIKEIKDEEGNTYKIFAIDGLTKGCEVEYLYTLKKYPVFFGSDIYTTPTPTMQAQWNLITPAHLLFEAKSYNGLGESKDSIDKEKRFLTISSGNISEAAEEKYSMYQANLKRVEYKLSFNKAKNATERLFTWNELAQKAYSIYTALTEKDVKKIKDLLKEAGIEQRTTELDKIKKIEKYIKKNFIPRDDISIEDGDDMVKAIKTKVMSERAYGKLFAGMLKAAAVDFQIVLTGDRTDYMVDRNFENWNNAKNLLFYFPGTDKYLAPTEVEYRYPWIPPYWAGMQSVFCVTTTIGNFTTAMAEIRTIPFEDYTHSFSNLVVNVKLDKEDALLLDIKQLYGGYTAVNYKAPFVFLPAEEQKAALKEMVKFSTNSENMLSHKLENAQLDMDDPYKPFVINAQVRSTQLIERAGEKYLLKIGELIGEQTQLYEAKPRETGIDIYYPHALVRDIEIEIPEGYEIKNVADLNFNLVHKENENVTMGFVCTYEQQGNKLKVRIQEDYKNVIYPAQQYDAFKKVINAAADFNKVVLILDKKA